MQRRKLPIKRRALRLAESRSNGLRVLRILDDEREFRSFVAALLVRANRDEISLGLTNLEKIVESGGEMGLRPFLLRVGLCLQDYRRANERDADAKCKPFCSARHNC